MFYRKGAQFEREVGDKLRAKGFQVVRSAGSHTSVDLVAIGKKTILLIQCKRSDSNNLNIRSVLRGKDVRELIKIPIDRDIGKVIRCVVMIRRQRIYYQLLWTGKRWTPVQII